MASKKSDDVFNTREIRFLAFLDDDYRKNGWIFSPDGKSVEGLYDPWGNPYTAVLDTDGDGTLKFKVGTDIVELRERRCAVFSPGPDKRIGTADDVITW